MYKAKCGINNLKFAFGHDEYMYRMLKFNKCTLPEDGLNIIRLHSCYAWHTGGNYDQFMGEGDEELKNKVVEFNQFDLYVSALI